MAGFDIENQGRHGGGFRELAEDLWANKPLLIVFAAALFLVVYVVAKNKSMIAAPGSTTPANSTGSQGNYLVVNDITPPDVNVTVNSPATNQSGSSTPVAHPINGTGLPGPVPGPFQPRLGTPIATPIATPAPAPTTTHPLTGSPSTVAVLPGANLSSIAQAHGVNEQALYNLNKSKIGPNPNLIHPGMVLTLPK